MLRPPQGAIAGLALVERNATHPAAGAWSVKNIAVPKWFEFRTATAPMPCALARRIASPAARAAITWPTPSCPSITASAPASTTISGFVTARITPARSRATYQESRITPCD